MNITGRARRLADPRWDWLTTALGHLHAELAPGDHIISLTVEVYGGGQVVFYGRRPGSLDTTRHVVTDLSGLLGSLPAVGQHLADATVPPEIPPAPGGEP